MRIFVTFDEAFKEIRRDLAEMGTIVKTKTMQDKYIANDPDYITHELMNYIYCITSPQSFQLNPTQPWADNEWIERRVGIEGNPINPGEAYKLRPDIWNEFIGQEGSQKGKFAYTYSERLFKARQVKNVIDRLKEDKGSRQLFISMWRPWDSLYFGTKRIPCSLGWHFMCREDKLHMTYFMRSCDFATHFQNDVYLSLRLQRYVAEKSDILPGRFTHFISSLHIYKKDIKDVF